MILEIISHLSKFNCDKSNFLSRRKIRKTKTAHELLKRPQINYKDLFIDAPSLTKNEIDKIEAEAKYEGYIKRHLSEIQKVSQNENLRIDKDTDYSAYSGLSVEAVEKLSLVKPETFGQACRISGVSPADVSVLMVYLFKS